MPLRLTFLLLVSLSAHSSFAQFTVLEQQHATVEYASTNNPNYWKNRKPFPGYWQQDVNYQIKANIDEVRDAITGTERLVYTNNSPDTLRWVFFHLYQNAFQPGSYCDALHKANDYQLRYGPYESMRMGTLVNKITVNGLKPKTELDNTLLKVWLPEMLLPGQSVEFDIEFLTAFDAYGNVRRRMKMFNAYGNKHFDGVHWYPRLAVYDRKFGWCTDQHLGKEFYGNFGSYEVELTFSSDYVVEATGVLLNKSEVLPDTLMKKLDMRNFASKKWDEAPSVITPYQRNKRKTWKYRAINVHDFAWTADPTYRIGEAEWNGIKIVALVQEPHASRWQNAADYTAKIIETYSRDFGMYVYNKMVVADARDGMEYPMLTLDGDADPGYRDLLAHEVGHNWFFGMVGSNETYRASLDEGFTQFLTSWVLENIDGPQTLRMPHPNAYAEKFTTEESVRYTTVYRGYLRDAIREDETTLNTHSDDFGGALRHGGGYGNVYYKTATMLYNLQYVLGDTLFLRAMKHYFNQWKMAHPYPEDFRNSIIQFTKADLNWFFDQWFETYKTIDYKVYKPKDLGDGKYRLRIKRKGAMQMPLDLRVTDADGKFYNYYIPNTWFEKSTSAQILPRWIGWGKLNPIYETEITIPAGIENVEIDTTGRLADVIRYNNTLKSKQTVKFDSRVQNAPDWKHYEMFARPDLWYNFYDGVKIGMHMNGHYMQQRHKFELSFWLNNGLGKVQQSDVNDMNGYNLFSFSMRYQTPTHQWVKHSRAVTEARYLDGLRLLKLGWELDTRSEQTTFYVFGKYMERRDTSDINYLIYKKEWNPAAINITFNTGLRHSYSYKRGSGNLHLGLRTTAPGSDYDFSQLSLEVINDNYLRRWNIRTRFFAQYGSGSNWAPESQLYLAGANPEQLMENKFTRSAAFVPQSFSGYGANTNHFHAGGGLNVRGYSGYAAPHTLNNGSVIPLYKGASGVSGNIEIDLDHLAPLKPRITRKWLKMDVYLFGDAGYLAPQVNQEPFKWEHIRASAGAGTALTIKSWGPLTMERPLVLRFDVPFFLNRTPDVSPDYVQFRWIVGINRSF